MKEIMDLKFLLILRDLNFIIGLECFIMELFLAGLIIN
ncbi:hypothetical protein NMH_1001 [Neisseria meningitidis H44/76]|uniref:Uncharacterized protein n=2 Tax=Neisseria meningitidis serogroup B TaxID=491 RepID=A0A0H5QFG8_NEIMI|nr:hypothetical protein NMH_1001 [Neisseria meningitidis H44/76]CRZ00010.1 hypothetical protein [Neisseria meningitidis serogroup B]